MKRSWIFLPLACLVVLVGAAVAHAGDGWRLPVWNPFARETPQERARARVSDSRRPTLPKLALPQVSLPEISMPDLPMPRVRLPQMRMPGRNTGQPGPLTRLHRGTQELLVDTKHTLLPWTRPAPRRSVTGSRNARREPERRSFFASWFEDDEPEIRTVNDFLAQPRPGID